MINRIVSDIRVCLDSGAYIAALTLALTIPDICGKAEFQDYSRGKRRYISWYNRYFHFLPAEGHEALPNMTGEVVYDLRCQLLHTGNPSIQDKNKINRFIIEYETNKSFIGGDSISARLDKDRKITYCTYIFNLNSFCLSLCAVAEWYYEENKNRFTFFDYELVDRDTKIEHYQLTKENYETMINEIMRNNESKTDNSECND